jgi:hypothetical protein
MNIKWQISGVLAAVYLLFSVSCSPTAMREVWKDKNYQGGKLKKILVIGVSNNPRIRRVFEDEFVEQLKAHGTDAVTSYRLIPSEEMLKKDTVESKMKTVGADAVIVTSLVDKQKHKVSSSNYTSEWHTHYRTAYETHRYRTTHYEFTVFSLETNLYEIRSKKMIWSGLSETQMASGQSNLNKEGSVVKAIKDLIKIIVDHLSDGQLI